MRILLIGKLGQVGWELQRTLSTLGEVRAFDRPEIELSSPDCVRTLIRTQAPAVIVNAAAYTAVDKAEDEPELAKSLNASAPAIMAEEAKRIGAVFVTYSTDYVFDGTKVGSYSEQDSPNPLSVYGKTKLDGDNAVRDIDGSYLIFRTSWVYGARGKNFLLTMMRLIAEKEVVKVVDDQIGAPTWSRSLAEITAQVLSQRVTEWKSSNLADVFHEVRGVYNLTSAGKTSWCGFTKAITERMKQYSWNSVAEVAPIRSEEYPVRAKRPQNSVLDNSKLATTFGVRMPGWEHALSLVMDELMSINVPSKSRNLLALDE